jgi:hypothetical protein
MEHAVRFVAEVTGGLRSMPLSYRIFVIVMFALGFVHGPALLAQRVSDTKLRVLVGAGLDADLRERSEFLPAPSFQVGVERALPASRLSYRAAGDYYTRSFPTSTGVLGRTHIFGVGLFGKYALTTNRIQPYAVGGLGVQHLIARNHRTIHPSGGGPTETDTSWTARRTSPALSGGMGVQSAVGSVSLFLESRYTFLPNGGAHIRRFVAPITLGARF